MSMKAHDWRKNLRFKIPSGMAVLSILCDYADENGVCCVSYSTLCEQSGFAKKTIITAIKNLCEAKLLEKIVTINYDKGNDTNRYILNFNFENDVKNEKVIYNWNKSIPNNWDRLRKLTIQRDGNVCIYCSNETEIPQIDHIIPLSKGGNNDLSNLAVSCKRCNSSKRNSLLEEWVGRYEYN